MREQPVRRRDAVLQRPLVERVAGKLGQARVHAVLNLQSYGLHPEGDESLEHALTEASSRRLLRRHHRSELAVIAHHHHLLRAHDERDEALGFRRLRALVHEHLAEAKVRQPRVAGADGGYAHDVRRGDNLPFDLALQPLVSPFVVAAQLAELVLELLQLLELRSLGRVQVRDLVVEGEVLHGRRHVLSGPRRESHDAQPRALDLLRELVHGDVGGGAHDHLPEVLLRELVHDRRGCHRFSGSRRALDEAERSLQHRARRALLRVVERR